MKKAMIMAVAVIFACLMPGGVANAGDVAAGEAVFKKCRACHQVEKAKNGVGPHLVNVFGRKAGGLADFKRYSKPMQESGIVWDDATMDAYLEDPKKVIPRGSMAFAGLKDKKDRDDVIAYIRQFSK